MEESTSAGILDGLPTETLNEQLSEVLEFLHERPNRASLEQRIQEWNSRCREHGHEGRVIPTDRVRGQQRGL